MLELQAAVDRSLEYFKVELQTKRALRDEQWRFKRDACLKALAVADAMLSNYNYPNVSEGEIVKQDCSTEEVRGCLNALACSCESSEVIEQLKKILFDSVSPDSIIDLRTAVRKSLDSVWTALIMTVNEPSSVKFALIQKLVNREKNCLELISPSLSRKRESRVIPIDTYVKNS